MILRLRDGLFWIFLIQLSFVASTAFSKDAHRGQAMLLHSRIAGVPADAQTLDKMVALIEQDKLVEAALIATEHPDFYNLKLRTMFSAWSNEASSVRVNLNDMVATLIGMVRDDTSFAKALSGDIVYVDGQTKTKYSLGAGNKHYDSFPQYQYKERLELDAQSKLDHALPEKAIAGVLSTRAFGEAFFDAGTNRVATAAVLKNFMCKEMEEVHDTSLKDNYVRRDVTRAPGGDVSLFRSRCVGCHAGMDAISGWNVYYDFKKTKLVYTDGEVQEKITANNEYDGGHVPTDDSFENLWTGNTELGFRGDTKGSGAKQFGELVAGSSGFSHCMAQHVFEQVCFGDADYVGTQTLLTQKATEFEENDYNMRKLFASTAVSCLLED